MRVNIYAEEMTDRIEIIAKEIDGKVFTGLRFYLELPVTIGRDSTITPPPEGDEHKVRDGGDRVQLRGPFLHHPGDDDSAAVTFWGKQDLRYVLRDALRMLDEHYDAVASRAFAKVEDRMQPTDAEVAAAADALVGPEIDSPTSRAFTGSAS